MMSLKGRKGKLINLALKINETSVEAFIDTGATASCISEKTAERLKVNITEDHTRLMQVNTFTYPIGACVLDVTIGSETKECKFFVIKGFTKSALLGLDICGKFGMVIDLKQDKVYADDKEIEIYTLQEFTDTTQLTEKEAKHFNSLIEKFADIFSSGEGDIGCLKDVKHEVITIDHPPINKRAYTMNQMKNDEIDRQVAILLKNGFVRPSKSPWGCPIVLVEKQDKSLRFCCDFRELNKITIPYSMQMPLISEIFGQLKGCKYFTSIDITSGFWHVPMHPKSIEKTAFNTRSGHYEWTVMPFGLRNAPATFQCAVQNVLGNLLNKGAINYSDDIIIYSKDFTEHLDLLKQIFKILKEKDLKLKRNKCHFFCKSITYLGHVISENEVRPSERKTKAIREFERPTTVKQVRSFLGLANYYRRFIKDFSKIATPLHKLCGKNQTLEWDGKAENAFQILKKKLCEPPVLTMYDPANQCVLYTDACKDGIGAILCQKNEEGKEQVIGYYSHKNNSAQQNYTTTELECLAVIAGVREFKEYLLPGFIVYTDHSALTWLLNKSEPKGRLHRWVVELSMEAFTFKHREGKQMTHVDALSRAPIIMTLTAEELIEAQTREETRTQIAEPVISEDVVCIKRKDRIRAVVPFELREQLLIRLHDDMFHPGMNKTYQMITRHYWWPKMANDIEEYVRSCINCQLGKVSHTLTLGLAGRPEMPSQPMEIVGIDSLEIPVRAQKARYKYIIVIVDHFSRYVWVHLTDTNDATAVIRALTKMIEEGFLPKKILSDNGRNYTSGAVKEFLKQYDIKHNFSSPYHPQTNGHVERYNDTIVQKLRTYLIDKARKWTTLAEQITARYNDTPHDVTRFPPRYLLKGELDTPFFIKNETNSLEEDRILAAERMTYNRDQRADRFDERHKEKIFTVNDWVIRKVPNNHPDRHKLYKRFDGPFRIAKVISNWTYEITTVEEDTGKTMKAHVSQLREFHRREIFKERGESETVK
jgi:transposase InsO family protein